MILLEETPKLKLFIIASTSVACLFTLYLLSSTVVTENNLVQLNKDHFYENNLCTSDTFNNGTWIHQSIGLESSSIEGINTHVGYYCNWDFPHRCYRRSDHPSEFNRSKAILDYTWQPNDCRVLPFDARKLSDHLADNPILFVGDSITQLMFESMWCLTGQDIIQQDKNINLSGGDTGMWAGQLVHKRRANEENAVTIAYIRSDYLVKLDDFSLIKPNEGEGYQIGVGSNYPWVHALSRFKYVMINTGPHWHPDLKWGPNKNRDELLKSFEKAMKNVFEYLKKNVRSDQRIWVRSSPYGHSQCSQYTKPSEIAVKPTGKPGEYEWDMLEKFDLVWKNLIQRENDERFLYFDVSISNLRGDAHSQPDQDCLHTCIPGPVDDWNKFLSHEMTRLIIQQTIN